MSGSGGGGAGRRWPRLPDDGDFVDHVVVSDGCLGLLVQQLGCAIQGAPPAFEDDPALPLADLFYQLHLGSWNFPFFSASSEVYRYMRKSLDHCCRIEAAPALFTILPIMFRNLTTTV